MTLRTGYTTGSCAAAAAKAGVLFLAQGVREELVDIPLPGSGRLSVPIESIERESGAVRVTVIKDGGDDPDATHGAKIQAVVALEPGPDKRVAVHGGHGVGRVTLPGLPVEVGSAAINPEPRKQIVAAVLEGMGDSGHVSVTIEVPDGPALAAKTMNERLGILGGISILGTHGIVKPYSHESWQATIREGLDVACALDIHQLVFTTGRRSERFHQLAFPGLSDQAYIQAADFFGFAMAEAAAREVSGVTWSVFFGKLVKQAQGLEYTHARTAPVDFGLLACRCLDAGVDPALESALQDAVTARHVLELVRDDPAFPVLMRQLARTAGERAESFAGRDMRVNHVVFDFDGTRIG